MQATKILRDIIAHPANRGRRARALTQSVAWQWHKRTSGTPRQHSYHGGRFILYPDSEQSSAVVYFSGWPDYWEMQFLAQYLRPGDVVMDIGANVGVYTTLAALLVGPTGRVVAFEPGAESRERLLQQVTLNGFSQVTVLPHAVSDRSGTVEFTAEGSTATRHIEQGLLSAGGGRRVAVDCIALNDWPDWQHFDLLKIDIEGAEPLAFAGASERLRDTPPAVILFELAGYSQLFGFSSERVLALLADFGYEFVKYEPDNHRLTPAGKPWELGITNVLAIHRGAKALVVARLGD